MHLIEAKKLIEDRRIDEAKILLLDHLDEDDSLRLFLQLISHEEDKHKYLDIFIQNELFSEIINVLQQKDKRTTEEEILLTKSLYSIGKISDAHFSFNELIKNIIQNKYFQLTDMILKMAEEFNFSENIIYLLDGLRLKNINNDKEIATFIDKIIEEHLKADINKLKLIKMLNEEFETYQSSTLEARSKILYLNLIEKIENNSPVEESEVREALVLAKDLKDYLILLELNISHEINKELKSLIKEKFKDFNLNLIPKKFCNCREVFKNKISIRKISNNNFENILKKEEIQYSSNSFEQRRTREFIKQKKMITLNDDEITNYESLINSLLSMQLFYDASRYIDKLEDSLNKSYLNCEINYGLQNYSECVFIANSVLDQNKISVENKKSFLYMKALAFKALGKNSEMLKAIRELKVIDPNYRRIKEFNV